MNKELFRTYGDIRKKLIGSTDEFKYYNPITGRPIKAKNVNKPKYKSLILFSYNESMGYKGLTWLNKTTDNGIIVCKELFDQNNEFKTFNELYDAFINYIDFQIKPEN